MGLWDRVGYSPVNDIAGIFFALMKVVLIFLLKANTISLSNVCFCAEKTKKMFPGLGRNKCVSGDFRSSKSQNFLVEHAPGPPYINSHLWCSDLKLVLHTS